MLFLLLFALPVLSNADTILTTKFFVVPVEPTLFDWTLVLGDKFEYHAQLLNYPDLPNWIQYLYSRQHQTGFLYGVPPVDQSDLEVEIIGTNLQTYETRRRVIHFNVQDKLNIATNFVHLKIDNINADDLFDTDRLTKLLDIFRQKLWRESFLDLYVTFLNSAINQGARRPLKPNESEGVVLRIGSAFKFSNTLVELQEEVRPLWKLRPCPRDFKRTTVERIFRDEGFALDWCSFHLISETAIESDENEKIETFSTWKPIERDSILSRNYGSEFVFTILAPIIIMIVLMIILSGTLCLHHDKIKDDYSERFFKIIFFDCEELVRKNDHTEKDEPQTDLNGQSVTPPYKLMQVEF